MSGARSRQIGIGDRILVAGRPAVVIGIAGARVRMADEEGMVGTATVAELVADPRFELPAAAPAKGPGTGLEGLPAVAVAEASWWQAHIAEVVYGLRPDAPPGSRPRPE